MRTRGPSIDNHGRRGRGGIKRIGAAVIYLTFSRVFGRSSASTHAIMRVSQCLSRVCARTSCCCCFVVARETVGPGAAAQSAVSSGGMRRRPRAPLSVVRADEGNDDCVTTPVVGRPRADAIRTVVVVAGTRRTGWSAVAAAVRPRSRVIAPEQQLTGTPRSLHQIPAVRSDGAQWTTKCARALLLRPQMNRKALASARFSRPTGQLLPILADYRIGRIDGDSDGGWEWVDMPGVTAGQRQDNGPRAPASPTTD
jgi:hypothetical protein